MMTPSEQEYIRHIYLFCKREDKISTNELALLVNTKASSVTDMIKRLSSKSLLVHHKYYGCTLTEKGKAEAISIVRRNVLWELFLVRKLGMSPTEAKKISSQLQSVDSKELIDRLSAYLQKPWHDIRGEIIPY